jgi:hypothetical protein
MNHKSVKTSFATHEVVVLTGFSKHMLDYLARDEIFVPSLSPCDERDRGKRRAYSYQDVVLLRALKKVCEGRGKIRYLKAALAAFQKEYGPITPATKIERHLVLQGNELCVTDDQGAIRQLRDGQLTLSLIVGFVDARDDIGAKLNYDHLSGGFELLPEIERAARIERDKNWLPIKARRDLAKQQAG